MIYGKPGETLEQAYVREARAVRDSAGIADVSTLGKIAVQGPDAAAFLDRVYTNIFSTLAVGKARYGLMLRDDGFAFDDGTTWRLGDNDFLMTTTTANAGKVMQHLEYFLDVAWPELKVHLTSVTDQWAGAAIGGPEGAGNPRSLRHRHGGRQRGAALHGHRAWRDRRRAGDDLPPLLLRRDGLRGLLRRRPRHPCLGTRCSRPASRSAWCPTGWRRSARCASRRATSPAPRSTAAPPRATCISTGCCRRRSPSSAR